MSRVYVALAHPRIRFSRAALRPWVFYVLRAEGYEPASVGVIGVDSAYIRRLHRDYLGQDRVTDVMAFRLNEGPRVVGEVYIGLDQALRQAAHYGVDPEEELLRLLVHGLLHLCGYDDQTEAERRRMFARQEAYLQNPPPQRPPLRLVVRETRSKRSPL
ncbi:MAG: rRNA maturation RNase YbeY [Candidatus Bipolaricaulaceae bacterium]